MNENVVWFKTAMTLQKAGFPQEIYLGQIRYLEDGRKALVSSPFHKLILMPWVSEHIMWSLSEALPIETETIFAPNARDIWQKLPTHFRPGNLTEEKESEKNPEGYAAIWIEENT
jgi:hypothetical protein